MLRPTDSCLSVEQRKVPDRRMQPTSFWSAALRWHGRRAGFRRAGEGMRAYVDQPSRRIILLVLFIMLASVSDAFLTLLHLDNGGSEANPIMAVLLQQSTASFLCVKMCLTGIGAWLLAAHEHFPMAGTALHVMAVIYSMLLVLHAVLFWS